MAKQKSSDELMAEFFRMLMADAQQAQKQSAPHEEYCNACVKLYNHCLFTFDDEQLVTLGETFG